MPPATSACLTSRVRAQLAPAGGCSGCSGCGNQSLGCSSVTVRSPVAARAPPSAAQRAAACPGPLISLPLPIFQHTLPALCPRCPHKQASAPTWRTATRVGAGAVEPWRLHGLGPLTFCSCLRARIPRSPTCPQAGSPAHLPPLQSFIAKHLHAPLPRRPRPRSHPRLPHPRRRRRPAAPGGQRSLQFSAASARLAVLGASAPSPACPQSPPSCQPIPCASHSLPSSPSQFVAVYDGHSSHHGSEHAARRVHEFVASQPAVQQCKVPLGVGGGGWGVQLGAD